MKFNKHLSPPKLQESKCTHLKVIKKQKQRVMNLLICQKTPQQKQKTLQKHVKSRKVADPNRNKKLGRKGAASFCKQVSSYNCIKILRQVEKSTKIIHQCKIFFCLPLNFYLAA